MTGAPVGELSCGGSGRGACMRAQLEPAEVQDMPDCEDMLEKTDAWPDEPELVEDTEILGR